MAFSGFIKARERPRTGGERKEHRREGGEGTNTGEKTRGEGLTTQRDQDELTEKIKRKERIKGENRTSKHRKEEPGRTDRARPRKKKGEHMGTNRENTG